MGQGGGRGHRSQRRKENLVLFVEDLVPPAREGRRCYFGGGKKKENIEVVGKKLSVSARGEKIYIWRGNK